MAINDNNVSWFYSTTDSTSVPKEVVPEFYDDFKAEFYDDFKAVKTVMSYPKIYDGTGSTITTTVPISHEPELREELRQSQEKVIELSQKVEFLMMLLEGRNDVDV